MDIFKKSTPSVEELDITPLNTEESLLRLKDRIQVAYANLNYVTEPTLIDSWIYEINAASLRYDYLLHLKKDRK